MIRFVVQIRVHSNNSDQEGDKESISPTFHKRICANKKFNLYCKHNKASRETFVQKKPRVKCWWNWPKVSLRNFCFSRHRFWKKKVLTARLGFKKYFLISLFKGSKQSKPWNQKKKKKWMKTSNLLIKCCWIWLKQTFYDIQFCISGIRPFRHIKKC